MSRSRFEPVRQRPSYCSAICTKKLKKVRRLGEEGARGAGAGGLVQGVTGNGWRVVQERLEPGMVLEVLKGGVKKNRKNKRCAPTRSPSRNTATTHPSSRIASVILERIMIQRTTKPPNHQTTKPPNHQTTTLPPPPIPSTPPPHSKPIGFAVDLSAMWPRH